MSVQPCWRKYSASFRVETVTGAPGSAMQRATSADLQVLTWGRNTTLKGLKRSRNRLILFSILARSSISAGVSSSFSCIVYPGNLLEVFNSGADDMAVRYSLCRWSGTIYTDHSCRGRLRY